MTEQTQDDRESAAGRSRRAICVGEFMAEMLPEMVASLQRAQAKHAAFCESIRPQFDAAPSEKACRNHPCTMRPKLFDETCEKSHSAREFRIVYAPCPDCKGGEAKERQRDFWRKRGVPERVIDATFDSFVIDTKERAAARASAMQWIKDNGVFLMLRGTTGTGKGHLAAASLKAHTNGLWITHAKMLADLRESYSLHTTKSLIASWQDAECLVIDELGVSAGGKDEETMFYEVIADRHDKRRPTIFTTNKTSEEYKALLGYRLVDRIAEECTTIVCAWKSWRTGK